MCACVTITRETSSMAYPAPSRPASMAASPPSGRSGRQTPQSTTVTLSPSAMTYMLTLSMAFTPIGNATRVTPGIESRADWLTGRLPARSAPRLWLARLRLGSSVQTFQEGEPDLELDLVGGGRLTDHPGD